MKISGFTIVRNITRNDYPAVEAICSILPLVNEMIVLVGDCSDNTLEVIQAIPSPKIKIFHSTWDPAYFRGGRILAIETDKALQHVSPDSDWAFYIQADEVVHEKYHAAILQAAAAHLENKQVQGLLFRYLHFYATYDYVGDSRKWYQREVRIIRNDRSIHSYRDAQGFRINGKKLKVKPIDAWIYHYGWVKNPRQMQEKRKEAAAIWSEREDLKQDVSSSDLFDYTQFDSLEKFRGTHPAVMQDRIQRQNWAVDINISRKKFTVKEKLLYWWEKKSGIRLFEYKNYRII